MLLLDALLDRQSAAGRQLFGEAWAKHVRAWGKDKLSPARPRALRSATLRFIVPFAVCP
jgi:hypothetical protein